MAQSKMLEPLEDEALEQIAEIKKYRTYQGQNPEYRHRAKLAIGVIGAVVRLRATLANEESNRLISVRLLGDSKGSARLLIASGSGDGD